VKRDN